MRKYNALLLSATVLASIVLVSSCKDDDPPVPPNLSFADSEITANESDDTIRVQLVLDKAAPEDITVEYSLSGTAVDDVTAGNTSRADYEIFGEYGSIEIAKGQTSAEIKIIPYSDTDLDEDETIELTIEDVSTDAVVITRDDDVTVTLQQEDGLIVVLQWGLEDDGPYTDVDMDLFLWATNTGTSELGLTNFLGYNGNFNTNLVASTSPTAEYFFLPSAGLNNGVYGISCVYYSGAKDPMNFQVSFIKIVDGADQTAIVRKGTYSLANINVWDEDSGADPLLSLTFEKTANDFINIGEELSIQATGSRMGSHGIPEDLKRTNKVTAASPSFLKHLRK